MAFPRARGRSTAAHALPDSLLALALLPPSSRCSIFFVYRDLPARFGAELRFCWRRCPPGCWGDWCQGTRVLSVRVPVCWMSRCQGTRMPGCWMSACQGAGVLDVRVMGYQDARVPRCWGAVCQGARVLDASVLG